MSSTAIINILMVLSKHYKSNFFLLIDTLAQLIDENPAKPLHFPPTCYLSTICSTSLGDGHDRLKSLLTRISNAHKLSLVPLNFCTTNISIWCKAITQLQNKRNRIELFAVSTFQNM